MAPSTAMPGTTGFSAAVLKAHCCAPNYSTYGYASLQKRRRDKSISREFELDTAASMQLSSVKFSPVEELLWSGTADGWVHATRIPDLERYSSVQAHHHGVTDILPVPATAAALSVSADSVCCHTSGGLQQFAYTEAEAEEGGIPGGEFTSCLIRAQLPGQALLGRSSGALSLLDIHTGQLLQTPVVSLASEAVTQLRGPSPRGLVAIGCASGEVVLADPRAGFRSEQAVSAHGGGLLAMDLAGSLMATSGLGIRQGQVVQDTFVKVYDLRMAAKLMVTLPFPAGPTLLKFHTWLPSTLLVAGQSGIFTLADTQASQYAPTLQVDTEGDLITSADMALSGECFAFGGSGGFVHLWGHSQDPKANVRAAPVEIPSKEAPMLLNEDDSFAGPHLFYPAAEGTALSKWDPNLLGRVNFTPRVLDASALRDVKQVDFVTYIPNPFFRRDRPRGEASRLAASLRNTRQKFENGVGADQQAGDTAATISSVLPPQYRKALITVDAERKYEEFNFAKYNQTRFAGLENGIANCYANALVQVLYFIPALRAYLLSILPDAGLEFSLLDELALLFRMLAGESGRACQATNLFKALRQSREATGLGLLEGHAQKGTHGADIEVETNKDQSLARRIQGLQRFLLDKLHLEAVKRHGDGSGKPKAGGEASRKQLDGPAEENVGDQGGAGSREEIHREGQGKAPGQMPASAVVKEVFGITMKQQMQSLQGAKPILHRESQAFQIDLQYPRRKSTASTPDKAASTGIADPRPSFSQVLVASLRAESETRAWFNEELKYQYVRQTRVPLALPQVLAVGTGFQDQSVAHWWEPVNMPSTSGETSSQMKAWAPWALALELRGSKLAAEEADSAEQLQQSSTEGADARAVYELTAVISLVEEDLRRKSSGKPMLQGDKGHLVANVRVPASYLDKEAGLLPTPRPRPASPGVTPTRHAWLPNRFGGVPSLPEDPFEGLLEDTGGAASEAQEQEGAAQQHGLPDDPFGSAPSSPLAGLSPSDGKPGELEDLGQAVGRSSEEEPPQENQEAGPQGPTDSQAPAGPPDIPEQFAGLKVSAKRSNSLTRSGSVQKSGSRESSTWLLINDFSIMASSQEEALDLFEGHKVPCLLYYTQVSMTKRDRRQDFQVSPAPVLTKSSFLALCRAPPLQANVVGLSGLATPSFVPFKHEESPHAGMLLGLDAEFVAFSPPSKALHRGVEVETAPSRLGLARVSVVRGEGPLAGKACIDDYIRTTEPVYDYLTQYSGLHPGDLDPSTSPHHLTTLKIAYLKLRFLVDAGCIFVGHGLKKDFRMINIVVPPSQVIDTVDLFYLKRQRKLSLRFLAAYQLRLDIQKSTHDSIEDSRTALGLYKMYKKIQARGELRETLQSMYAWGKQHGWDPSALQEHPATNLPSPVKPMRGGSQK